MKSAMSVRARELLREMLGPAAEFRPGQWEAVETVAGNRRRALVVQCTGWGKSVVYFLAAKLLRETGAGPALLISPLLSLMRNQIQMATRIGIRAATIHSGNREEWETTETALAQDAVDVLLISPERLNNERFVRGLLPRIGGRVGLFVVDEAHCISDWGHDFRPDYRRIVRILQGLPRGVPVLATTATANDRVVADVQDQLGPELSVLRGSLSRPSLRLQNLVIPDQGQRLAWLAEHLPKFRDLGSGIIYCLTVADAERAARWLQAQGILALSYHADLADEVRVEREQALLDSRCQALVATVALGMGFDKPNLAFVIHFQRPGSVVAYYQQVGRAGRAVDRAYGILLAGQEDDDIQNYFIDSAFPRAEIMQSILRALEANESLAIGELLAQVNVARGVVEKALKLLEIDGAVGREAARYFRTPNPWSPDLAHIERVTGQRRAELEQMRAYVHHSGCLMEFLTRALDDPDAGPCGVCANCQGKGKGFRIAITPERVAAAVAYLRADSLDLEPRARWPIGLFPGAKMTIPAEQRNAPGRVLCYYGDAGWGKLVREGKYRQGRLADNLVDAAAELIAKRWQPTPAPEWVTAIPSHRHPRLVADFARRLADRLHLPFVPALSCRQEMPEQKTMANSAMQARNALAMLSVAAAVPAGPVVLVDDIIDSGWTITIAGWLLRTHGSGVVYPLVLARATTRNP